MCVTCGAHALCSPHAGDKEDGLAVFVNKHKFDVHHVQHIDFDHAGDRVALLLHLATKWNRHAAPLLDRVRGRRCRRRRPCRW